MSSAQNPSDLRETAVRLAVAAGAELLGRQRSLSIDAAGVETKSSASDPVSAADRASEKLIVDGITAARPDDGLLGEEGSSRPSVTGLTWVIDPLDGTVNYLYGRLDWCVSIAVEDAEGGLVGVVHQPRTGAIWSAVRGAGATRSDLRSQAPGADAVSVGVPLGPLRETELATALVSTGFSYLPERRAAQADILQDVLPAVRDIRRGGSAALDLCSVADGTADAYYEHVIQPWDVAAGALIAREAGATVVRAPVFPQGILAAVGSVVAPLQELLTRRSV
jgi:myo-inositol-1(or 4)-monophosphatase